MAPKFREGDVVVAFSGTWVSWVHTVVAYSAFIGALVTGLSLHYKKIVENEYYVGNRTLEWWYSMLTQEGLPRRMVSFSLRNHWGPLSRAICLSILHCDDLRQVSSILDESRTD